MRIKIFCVVLFVLMLNVVLVFAQGEPCNGTDPDATCPLDTWVIVLAGGAFLMTAVHLFRKQRAV